MNFAWTVSPNPRHWQICFIKLAARHHFHLQRQSLARLGCRAGPYPQGYRPQGRVRRSDRADRAVGVGEIHASDGDGGAGASRQRRGGGQRHPFQCPRRGRAGAVSRPPCRHRLPVLSSDPDHDRAGECRGAAGTGRQSRCVGTRRARTRIRRPRRPAASLSDAIVRRRAAARRARPRAGARSRHPGGGRADRKSRRGHRQADRRSACSPSMPSAA